MNQAKLYLVVHAPTDRDWLVEGEAVSLEFKGNASTFGVVASRCAPTGGKRIPFLWDAGDAVIAAHRSIVNAGGRGYTPESTLVVDGQPVQGWHVARVG